MLVIHSFLDRRRDRDDSGAALVAVVMVMLVGAIVASAIAASVIFAVSTNATNKGRTQAFIAAESGRDAALVQLKSDLSGCTAEGSLSKPIESPSASAPKYEVEVFSSTDENATVSGQGVQKCPGADSKVLILRSTGTAPGGATSTIETAYKLVPAAIAAPSSANDMEFYNGAEFDAGINLTGTTTGDPFSVMVVAGDWTCRTTVQGNVTVGGNITGNGGCRVQGDVYAKGNLLIQSGDVFEGNVTAAGTGTATVNGKVLGDLWVGGGIDFGWTGFTFPGNVMANGAVNYSSVTLGKKLLLPKGSWLQRDGWVNIAYPTSTDARIKGGIEWLSAPQRPTNPTVNAWHEYHYVASEWPGFTNVITLVNSGNGKGTCNYFAANNPSNDNAGGWRDLATLTTPTVLDARACTSLSSNNGSRPNITIKTDLLVLAKQYDLTNLTVRAATGTSPRVWLTVEDPKVSDGLPTCSNGAGSIMINATAMIAPVQSMAYTPCTIDVKGTTGASQWTGAFYSGNFSYGGGLTFKGDKSIGLPGMGATGPGGGGSSALPSLGGRTSQQEVSDVK